MPMDLSDSQLLLIVTTGGTALMSGAAALGTWLNARKTASDMLLREERQRGWALEDRRIASEDRRAATAEIVARAAAEAEALRIKTEGIAQAILIEAKAQADRVQAAQLQAAATLSAKIQEVHEVATNAFKEANGTNLKIEDTNKHIESLNQRLVESERLKRTAADEALASMADRDTVADRKLDSIEEKVDVIKDKVHQGSALMQDEVQDANKALDSIETKVDVIKEKVATIRPRRADDPPPPEPA